MGDAPSLDHDPTPVCPQGRLSNIFCHQRLGRPLSLGSKIGRMGLDDVSAQVAGIVDSAERAAHELRAQADTRARERIAEAARAADNRVQAAEAEAQEILHAARAQAELARNEALSAVAAIHAEAERARSEAE